MVTDDVELRHLRSFVAVADELNFSRAARSLHMTQQSLSAQIQQLEHRIGVRLLHRTTRQVELTEAGRVLLEHARLILGDVSSAVDRTRRAARGQIGHLSLSYTPTVAHDTLPVLLAEVHERTPELTLRVSEMWQAESVEGVRAGRLDAGLARYPELPDELEAVRIRDESLGVVVCRDHPLATRPVIAPADLSASTMIIWPRDFSPGFFDQIVGTYRDHGFRGTTYEMQMLTSGSFLRDPEALDLMTHGRAFSPAFEHQHDPLPPEFVWRSAEPAPMIAVQLFWRRDPPPAVRSLLALVQDVSRRQGWLHPMTSPPDER